jgi:hypothetical protein
MTNPRWIDAVREFIPKFWSNYVAATGGTVSLAAAAYLFLTGQAKLGTGALAAFALLCFFIASFQTWRKETEMLTCEIAKNEVPPEIELQMRGIFFREQKAGRAPTDVFVCVGMTLRNPREVSITSFELVVARGATQWQSGSLKGDLDKWEWAKEHPEKGYERESLDALRSELNRRGDQCIGWLYFEVNLAESELVRSKLELKISSKNGTCSREIDGRYGSSVGGKEKGRIWKAGSLHVWSGTDANSA